MYSKAQHRKAVKIIRVTSKGVSASILTRRAGHRERFCEGGFTLIETIMIIVLLGILASGILMYFTGIGRGSEGFLLSQAAFLAQEKMEEIIALNKADGFDSITSQAPATLPSPFDNFTREVEVFCVDESDLNTSSGTMPECSDSDIKAKRVRVTVSWQGGSIDLVTVVSDH